MNRSIHLLYVEDREDDAQLVLREVRRSGFEVTHQRVDTAESMREALESADWDLVLADYTMPHFSALKALEILHQSGRDIPFIIVSGTVSEEIAVQVLKAGAHDFIPKDNLRRLVPAIERELREADSRRERRRAEEELKRTTETMAAVLNASPVPMILLDENACVLRWNPASERVFGWKAEEVVGKPVPFVPAEAHEQFEAAMARVYAGEPLSNVEGVRQRKDGAPVHVLVSAAPIRNGQGAVDAVMGILVDITEQRLLEEQFRHAQKMEAIGRLAGGVAHDFNNVLTAIHGYASLLLADMPETDQRRDDVQEILNAADRAASFTRQLLAFSRKQVVQRRDVDLNVLIAEMRKLLGRLVGEHITFTVSLSPSPALVHADQGQIEQVVINLVVNARDALPESGGGTITLRVWERTLEQDEAREHDVDAGPYCVIDVADSGSGIAPEHLHRIFEPFFTTKEVGKGTGLGLSTVYGIARQNGGFVRVNSAVGQGTTFSVFLPCAGKQVDVTEVVPPAPAPRAPSQHTIMVVEDEAAIRQLIVRVLERNGYRTMAAGDALEALEIIERDAPVDILLTDLMLPTMTGAELVRAASLKQPHLRSVIMSGYSEESVRIEGAFLEKPFTPKELLDKVAELLGH